MSDDFGAIVKYVSPERAVVRVSVSVYGLPAIFRTCYKFTDHHYLFLRPDGDDLLVFIKPKQTPSELEHAVGTFANELIDQRLRLEVAQETAKVRELIVAQAFAEGNLLPESQQNADVADDPLGITGSR